MISRNFLQSIKFERKPYVKPLWKVLYFSLALVAALLVTVLLMKMAGADPVEGFMALISGGFGGGDELIETLVRSTPLILTSLAVAISFRGKVYNIGAEGQLLIGALAAYWASVNFSWLSTVILVPVTIIIAFLGGALCGFIPAFLRAKFQTDEIIVTIMLNYIVTYLLSILVSGPWQDPNSSYQMSPFVPEAAWFPLIIHDSRLHIGFLVALFVGGLLYVILTKTTFGYELRTIGANRTAAKFKGTNISRTIFLSLIFSAGIAGLAGAGELLGLQHRLRMDMFRGDGYTGIIVAILSGLNPLAVVPMSVFFGGLANGSTRMQIMTGVPTALIYAIEAIMMLFLLIAQVISNYEITRVRHDQ